MPDGYGNDDFGDIDAQLDAGVQDQQVDTQVQQDVQDDDGGEYYQQVEQQLGGREGVENAIAWFQWADQQYRNNPQFAENWERMRRGEFGPQAQAQVQNIEAAGQQGQPGQPQQGQLPEQLKYLEVMKNPDMAVKFRMINNGALRPENPGYAEVKKAYDEYDAQQERLWYDPAGYFRDMLSHPEIIETLRQLVQPEIAPIKQSLGRHEAANVITQYRQELLHLRQHAPGIYKALIGKRLGQGENAIRTAMEMSGLFNGQPQQRQQQSNPQANGQRRPAPQNGPVNPNHVSQRKLEDRQNTNGRGRRNVADELLERQQKGLEEYARSGIGNRRGR